LICSLSTSFKIDNSPVSDNEAFINKIFESIDKLKTLRYELKCKERIKGKMQHTESKVKLQISPRKLYISVNGPEVLWIEGQNHGDAYVNPGAFPYINLNLDPYGVLMRKDQHHTIHEMGFQYLADILKHGKKRVGDKVDKYFKVASDEKFNGRPCYKLTIAFPDFAWGSYVVKKGENLTTIARKLRLSEYMILERNAKIKWYDDVKEGQVIQVPNAYAKLTILYIDKEYMLPVSNNVFDDLGLYETYEYYNMRINTIIHPEEFNKGYKDYKF
jgi:outer membrane lipoprotein-sorting protein